MPEPRTDRPAEGVQDILENRLEKARVRDLVSRGVDKIRVIQESEFARLLADVSKGDDGSSARLRARVQQLELELSSARTNTPTKSREAVLLDEETRKRLQLEKEVLGVKEDRDAILRAKSELEQENRTLKEERRRLLLQLDRLRIENGRLRNSTSRGEAPGSPGRPSDEGEASLDEVADLLPSGGAPVACPAPEPVAIDRPNILRDLAAASMRDTQVPQPAPRAAKAPEVAPEPVVPAVEPKPALAGLFGLEGTKSPKPATVLDSVKAKPAPEVEKTREKPKAAIPSFGFSSSLQGYSSLGDSRSSQ